MEPLEYRTIEARGGISLRTRRPPLSRCVVAALIYGAGPAGRLFPYDQTAIVPMVLFAPRAVNLSAVLGDIGLSDLQAVRMQILRNVRRAGAESRQITSDGQLK